MPRKKDEHPLNVLLEIVSMLPWWAGVILAAVSFMILHAIAGAPVTVGTGTNQIASSMIGGLIKAFAFAGQFIIPTICLIAAATSAWKRSERKSLVNSIAASEAPSALHGMTWREFELAVGEAFRLDGFQVEERGGSGADGGVDLVLRRGGEKFFVQCKQWKALKVGVDIVRELYGVMAAHGATGGFVVTSGTFSNDAIAFASGRNIVLVGGEILFDMIKNANRAPTANALLDDAGTRAEASAPTCPVCASSMVQRVAKKGPSAGRAFWGCRSYPACRGTRDIPAI